MKSKKIFLTGFMLLSMVLVVSVVSASICQVFYKDDFGRKLSKVNGNSNVLACCIDPLENLTDSCDCLGEEASNCDSAIQILENNETCFQSDSILINFAGCKYMGNSACGVSNVTSTRKSTCKRNDTGTGFVEEAVVSPAQELWNHTSNTSMGVHLFYENGTTVVQEDCGTAVEIQGLGQVYIAKSSPSSYCTEVNATAKKENINAHTYQIKQVQVYQKNDKSRRLTKINAKSEIFACCLGGNATDDCSCGEGNPDVTCNDLGEILSNLEIPDDAKMIDHAGCQYYGTVGCGNSNVSAHHSVPCKRNDAGTSYVETAVVSPAQELWNYTSNTSMGVHVFNETGTTIVQEDCGFVGDLSGYGKVYLSKNSSDPSFPDYCESVNASGKKESLHQYVPEIKMVQIYNLNGKARRLLQVAGQSRILACCLDTNVTNDCSCGEGNPTTQCTDVQQILDNIEVPDDARIIDHACNEFGNVGCNNPPCSRQTEIYTCADLQNISNDLSGNYKLMKRIDCSDSVNWNAGAGFKPIGNESLQFMGNIDGYSHYITNLHINRPTEDFVGLFGYLIDFTTVERLRLKDGNITGKNYVGGIFGGNDGEVDKVDSDAYVTGTDFVGGVGGINIGNITECGTTTTKKVTGNDKVGGVLGQNNGSVLNCFSHAEVEGNDIVGGFAGKNNNGIGYAYAKGKVNGNSNKGGLIGDADVGANASECYYDINETELLISDGCTGKTSAEMQDESTYSNWDLVNTWEVNSYPCLKWSCDDSCSIIISSANYTTSAGYLIAEDDSEYLNQSIKIYADWFSNQNPTARGVINDTSTGIAGVTSWFGIFIVISAMVVLILLVVIIITAIRGSGMMAEGGA
jgi:hypothetical protein